MATITVLCPTCDCELELDAQYQGQEVECGSCHQVFVAKSRAERAPPRKSESEPADRESRRERKSDSRGRRGPRRYADEDDDYDDDFYDRRRRRDTDDGSGLGDASLIIGILAVFVFWCPLIGVPMTFVGLILGCLGLRSKRNGTAIAGVVLSSIFLLGSLTFAFFWRGFR
jgi:Zn-finger nucleic acid-binding protein